MREYMLKTFICHFLPKDFFLVSRFECSYKNNQCNIDANLGKN